MSEATAQTLSPAPQVDKRAQVEALLTGMLARMEYPARLELKDLSDGSLGVAVFFEGELPGIAPGKRGHLVDCLQFLVNKCINRPGQEKRWVSLGVNGFPEPRQAKPVGQAPVASPATPSSPVPAASAPTPAGGRAQAPRPSTPPGRPAVQGKGPHDRHDKHADKHERHPDRHERRDRRDEPDERTLEVAADPLLGAAGKALAEKAAKLGRIYAVLMAKPEDRARLVQAAADVAGQKVRAEGEGIWRRVTFAPDKPVALPKNTHLMPDYDEEE